MITLDPVIPHLKALHIVGLAVWIAALASLPAMLAHHGRSGGADDYVRIRLGTHYGYIWIATPAAVLTVASGTALIFLREVFDAWMFAKLLGVAALVLLHARLGHVIVAVAETEGRHSPPRPLPATAALGAVVGAILLLVLSKPTLDQAPLPDWLRQPLGRELPFDVPNP